MAFDQSKYISDFMKDNYDRVVLQVPKSKRDLIKKAAQNDGKSMNQAIIDAIEEKYHLDLSKPNEMLPNIPTAPAAKSRDQGR